MINDVRRNENGEFEYTTINEDVMFHQINVSITPDKITKDHFSRLNRLVIPRIEYQLESEDDFIPNIIDYFPKRCVSEIKKLAECNLSNGSPLQIAKSTRAMLEYGDILLFGLKNVDQNKEKGWEYYKKAASIGDPEAYMAVAIILHNELCLKFPATKPEAVASQHMTDLADQQTQKNMWDLLEKAAKVNYMCLFMLGITTATPSSFRLPPSLQYLPDLESLLEAEQARAIEHLHRYPCSADSCLTFVYDASLLFPCHRCKSVKYCSRQCQSDEWRSHSIHCTALCAEVRESNLGAIEYQEPEIEVITTGEFGEFIVDKRIVSMKIGENTIHLVESLAPGSFINEEKNRNRHSAQSIMSDIRLPNMPDATFDELVVQAEVHITSRSYSQAIQCFTYALLKNDTEGEIVMTKRTDRMKLANTIARKIWCQVQGEEGQEHHDMFRLKLIREDCAFLLDTGIFDLNELGEELAQQVNAMDNQAKAWSEELVVEEVDEWIPRTMITARRRQQSRNNSSRKKKSKKKSKAMPPPFQLYPCADLIEHTEVKNAGSDQDYCPSCQTQWSHFIEPCYAVVLPCLHAMCCTCLIKFQNGCQQTFDTEVEENVQVAFVCALCREKLNANLSFEMAKVMIAKEDAIPSYNVFMRTVHFEDSRAADEMILHLLVQHEFHLSKVGDALFSMIGLLVNDDIADQMDLIPDEKQDIYVTARAPVRVLEGEIRKVRDRYNAHWKATNQEKRKFLHTLKCLKERLAKARENAANDIFERMNAYGGMGTLSGNTLLKIDIHGLHVEEAKAQIAEYVLPVLQVVSKVILITGRGRHSASGSSILKPALEAFLRSVEVNFRDVPGNDGAIWMYI